MRLDWTESETEKWFNPSSTQFLWILYSSSRITRKFVGVAAAIGHPSAIVSGSQQTAPTGGGRPAAGGQTHLTGYGQVLGVLRGREVSGSTRGAGTAVTVSEVPQHEVVSGRHCTRTRGNAPGWSQVWVLSVSNPWALRYFPDSRQACQALPFVTLPCTNTARRRRLLLHTSIGHRFRYTCTKIVYIA